MCLHMDDMCQFRKVHSGYLGPKSRRKMKMVTFSHYVLCITLHPCNSRSFMTPLRRVCARLVPPPTTKQPMSCSAALTSQWVTGCCLGDKRRRGGEHTGVGIRGPKRLSRCQLRKLTGIMHMIHSDKTYFLHTDNSLLIIIMHNQRSLSVPPLPLFICDT